MLTQSKSMLELARTGGYAIGHFNTYDLESTLAIIDAAVELHSPVIIAVSEKTIEFAGLEAITGIVKEAAQQTTIPVALHLDHGQDETLIHQAAEAGFTSIMFDGSTRSLEENISITTRIVKYLSPQGITVEAETGRIGGKEDYISGKVKLTSPDEAAYFVEATGIDILAPALGTAHGLPLKNEHVHLDLLQRIAAKVPLPLALHGASNLPPQVIQQAIKLGISKINIDTELRQAFSAALRDQIRDPEVIDPRVYLAKGRAAIKETVKRKILEFGSVGKG